MYLDEMIIVGPFQMNCSKKEYLDHNTYNGLLGGDTKKEKYG